MIAGVVVGLGVVVGVAVGLVVGVCVVVCCCCIRNTAAIANSINTTTTPIARDLFMVYVLHLLKYIII